MALPSGTKLGAYELLSPIGAGGMGEVYRARDSRLKRQVAVKILPSAFVSDLSRLRRFEQEARAAAALNHPNILVVYDVGTYRPTATEGTAAIAVAQECPYIVCELLQGETLRERLRPGALSTRKTIDYARQIANGLAAAHDKGIVHRDLKPENIFITDDGRVKILDFGVAKLMRSHGEHEVQTITQTIDSDAGTVLGTIGYMSPEQVRGRTADARSDLFSLGAILYEMVSGKRAFHRDSAAETMSAILKEDPPELREAARHVSPALERIVYHCLEKNPAERFQSARDVAFDLETVSGASSATAAASFAPMRQRRANKLAVIALVIASLTGGVLLGRRTVARTTVPSYEQLTFRRGTVREAKFTPDGQVIYSAKWDGTPTELFTATLGSSGRGSVSAGIRDADIESISRSGELLLVMNRKRVVAGVQPGTLARAPAGGAPRPIVEDVQHADWSPDGSKAAIAHYVGQHFRLEYPIGNTLYETSSGWISFVRVSPRGDMVAFLDHPFFGDDAGSVAIVDLKGHKRNLGPSWASVRGLQWGSRDELWFSANQTGIALTLYGVNTSGKLRTILRVPSGLKLLDVGKDGRVLIAQGQRRRQVLFSGPSDKTERDLAVADWCIPMTISDDGKALLLDEEAENTETGNYTAYLRKTDGSAPVRLGEGIARSMSRDGKWALVMTQQPTQQLVLLPTGAGEPHQITNDLIAHRSACFLDDTHIAFSGVEPGHQPRTYVQAIAQNTPRPITPEGVSGDVTCSPDGKAVLVMSDKAWYAPVTSGTPHPIPGTEAIFSQNSSWTSDPGYVYMVDTRALPIRINRVDVTTGARKEVKTIMPVDPAGAEAFEPVRVTPDLKSYVYNIPRNLNELYLVESLK